MIDLVLPRPARFAGRVFVAVVLAAPLVAHALPGYEDVRRGWRSSDWVLLARDGIGDLEQFKSIGADCHG